MRHNLNRKGRNNRGQRSSSQPSRFRGRSDPSPTENSTENHEQRYPRGNSQPVFTVGNSGPEPFQHQNPNIDFQLLPQNQYIPIHPQNLNFPIDQQNYNFFVDPQNHYFSSDPQNQNFPIDPQNQNFPIDPQNYHFPVYPQNYNFSVDPQNPNFSPQNQHFPIDPQNYNFPFDQENYHFSEVVPHNQNFPDFPQNQSLSVEPQNSSFPEEQQNQNVSIHHENDSVPSEQENLNFPVGEKSKNSQADSQHPNFSLAPQNQTISMQPPNESFLRDHQYTNCSGNPETQNTPVEPINQLHYLKPGCLDGVFKLPIPSTDEKSSIMSVTVDGESKETLSFFCECLDSSKQKQLVDMVNSCSCLSTLKLRFHSFRLTEDYNWRLLSFTNEKFELSSLKNLIRFEFKSVLEGQEVKECLIGRSFYANVLKHVIKCSDSIRELVLRTDLLSFYFTQIVKDSLEMQIQLGRLHTFKLNYEKIKLVEIFKFLPLAHFLKTIASNLEVLHICGVTWTDLNSYSEMSKLRVLCIQSNISYSKMKFSDKMPPKLDTLIFKGYEKKEEFDFEFGWPLNEQEFEFNLLNNSRSNPLSGPSDPPRLKVVLYAQYPTGNFNWEKTLRYFLDRLSSSTVYLDTLFLDLTSFCRINPGAISEEKLISKYFKRPKALNSCFVRYYSDGEILPIVCNIVKRPATSALSVAADSSV